MSSTLITFIWQGKTYHVASQQEKSNKPPLRIVQYKPAFKHISGLFRVMDSGTERFLFDTGDRFFELDMKGTVPQVIDFSPCRYMDLKVLWKAAQAEKFARQAQPGTQKENDRSNNIVILVPNSGQPTPNTAKHKRTRRVSKKVSHE